MPELWLTRHAPTADNVGGVVIGGADPEPLPDGLAAAAVLAGTLDLTATGRVVSSPQRRAVATARALFPEAAIAVDDRLRERHLGRWEGLSKDELPVAALTPSRSIDLRAEVPGGESLAAFGTRVLAFLEELAATERDETVFAVSHNGVIRLCRFLLGDLPLAEAAVSPVGFLEPLVLPVSPAQLAGQAALLRHIAG